MARGGGSTPRVADHLGTCEVWAVRAVHAVLCMLCVPGVCCCAVHAVLCAGCAVRVLLCAVSPRKDAHQPTKATERKKMHQHPNSTCAPGQRDDIHAGQSGWHHLIGAAPNQRDDTQGRLDGIISLVPRRSARTGSAHSRLKIGRKRRQISPLRGGQGEAGGGQGERLRRGGRRSKRRCEVKERQ